MNIPVALETAALPPVSGQLAALVNPNDFGYTRNLGHLRQRCLFVLSLLLISPLLLPLLLLFMSPLAFATDTGVIGSSGKQGTTCTACHMGGSYTSSIEISGNTTVEPNSTTEFSILMRHNAPFAGFNL